MGIIRNLGLSLFYRLEKSHFKENLQDHLRGIRISYPSLDSFVHRTFNRKTNAELATRVVAEMKLAHTDYQEHSFTIIHPTVFMAVSIVPVDLKMAREYFADVHGGYYKLLEGLWNTSSFLNTCSILCHIAYGWTRDGTWMNIAICPVKPEAPITRWVLPDELMTPEDRQIADRFVK